MNKHITRSKNTITAGTETIRTVTFQPTVPARPDQKSLVAVVGNGAFGGPRTFGRLMGRFVEAAAKDGVHATAVMHHDPWLGRGNYAESYRTERLARVLGHTASRTERPAHLVGHSWSWPSTLAIAKDSPKLVAALEGYTPNGHHELEPDGTKWHDLFLNAAREARHPAILSGIGSLGSGLEIARDMVVRFPTPTGRGETIRSFSTDLTDEVVAIRRDEQLPVGILTADLDEFFHPSEIALNRLSEAGVTLRSIHSTHLGAVTDHRHGDDLYRLATDLEPQRQ